MGDQTNSIGSETRAMRKHHSRNGLHGPSLTTLTVGTVPIVGRPTRHPMKTHYKFSKMLVLLSSLQLVSASFDPMSVGDVVRIKPNIDMPTWICACENGSAKCICCFRVCNLYGKCRGCKELVPAGQEKCKCDDTDIDTMTNVQLQGPLTQEMISGALSDGRKFTFLVRHFSNSKNFFNANALCISSNTNGRARTERDATGLTHLLSNWYSYACVLDPSSNSITLCDKDSLVPITQLPVLKVSKRPNVFRWASLGWQKRNGFEGAGLIVDTLGANKWFLGVVKDRPRVFKKFNGSHVDVEKRDFVDANLPHLLPGWVAAVDEDGAWEYHYYGNPAKSSDLPREFIKPEHSTRDRSIAFVTDSRRLTAAEISPRNSAAQSILAAFLLLLMMLVYLFSRRFTSSRKPLSYRTRIVRKKAPIRIASGADGHPSKDPSYAA